MDDTKAVQALTVEMQLTRSEIAALTDALRLQSIRAQELTQATNRLADLLEVALRRRGFRARMVG